MPLETWQNIFFTGDSTNRLWKRGVFRTLEPHEKSGRNLSVLSADASCSFHYFIICVFNFITCSRSSLDGNFTMRQQKRKQNWQKTIRKRIIIAAGVRRANPLEQKITIAQPLFTSTSCARSALALLLAIQQIAWLLLLHSLAAYSTRCELIC